MVASDSNLRFFHLKSSVVKFLKTQRFAHNRQPILKHNKTLNINRFSANPFMRTSSASIIPNFTTSRGTRHLQSILNFVTCQQQTRGVVSTPGNAVRSRQDLTGTIRMIRSLKRRVFVSHLISILLLSPIGPEWGAVIC